MLTTNPRAFVGSAALLSVSRREDEMSFLWFHLRFPKGNLPRVGVLIDSQIELEASSTNELKIQSHQTLVRSEFKNDIVSVHPENIRGAAAATGIEIHAVQSLN
jgi:hypothetical protein